MKNNKDSVAQVFCSIDVFQQTPLFERQADSWVHFERQLEHIRKIQTIFASRPITQRTAMLADLAERIAAQRDALAEMISIEVGRSIHECRAEVDKSIDLISYYAKLAPELLAHKTVATQASLSQVHFEPLGVVLAVMPWNYPVWQVLRFAIPALCAGNACLVKPAPTVGRVTTALFELVGNELPFQTAWLSHEDTLRAIGSCDALAFTGSTTTGRILAAEAGRQLKKTVLELGGSNAFIVLDDADIEQAARDACYSRFRDAGQSCNAAKRIIVSKQIAEPFLERFMAHTAKLQIGNPLDEATTLAPLHRADLRRSIHELVENALNNGAKLLCGGYLPDTTAPFYPATVIDNINPDCRLYSEEAFGPVAAILRAENDQDAIRLANDNPFGLGASIYSANTEAAWQLAEQLETGAVYLNRHTSSDLRMPFGGVKASGYGRELSEFGLYEFVNVKSYWQK